MTRFVALLRAVNVGGTGKLPMSELRAMASRAGFANIRTYIASGNVVFDADVEEADVRSALGAQLAGYAGKPVDVLVRTAAELEGVSAANPFKEDPPNRTVAIFLPLPPAADALNDVRHRTTERIALGRREIYIAYGDTMGRSRLMVPAAGNGTARNMNTVAALAQMASGG